MLDAEPPRLGLQLGNPPLGVAAARCVASRAASAGVGLLAAGDVHLDCFALLASLAGEAPGARLVASVAGWTRTPAAAAAAARTLQELAGGGLLLGLGPMPRAWSEGWHGISYDRPLERMRDYVGALRAALAASLEAPAHHDGPFYRLDGYAPPVAPSAAAPVALAATRPGMTRLAGEIADAVVFNAVSAPAWIRDVQLPALAAGVARASRVTVPERGAVAICAIDPDPRRARELARLGLAFYLVAPYTLDVMTHLGFASEAERAAAHVARGDLVSAAAALPDPLVETMTVTGDADDVADGLMRYRGLVDWLLLAPPIGQATDVTLEQLERLAALAGADELRRGVPS